ncbi:hypothetical protein [Agrobacterium tumefaciens]|uniref:phage adaptor protein n=1 Tax=Agrobacterium tumefaciens TaxID=358 RepID=UPI00157293CE|nr:hypothetical protein [Agrobacterium tumefaciens]
MREITVLLNLVNPFAPSLPEPTAVQWLRWAAIEFCKSTRVWRDERRFEVIGGADEQFCMPEYAAIHEIERSWFGTRELDPLPFGKTPRFRDDSQPIYLSQVAPNTVRLVPGAQEAGELVLHLFLKPSITAEDLPDMLIDDYGQQLAEGALSRILLLPNQPFTDLNMAMAYGQAFQAALDKNFSANIRGQQRAPARTKASYL